MYEIKYVLYGILILITIIIILLSMKTDTNAIYMKSKITNNVIVKPPKNIGSNPHIVNLSKLSYENGTPIFPRMGFLLGIVRHNGYLPNEGIDPDLACLEDDVNKLLTGDLGDYKITGTYDFDKIWDHEFYNGKHPLTNNDLKIYNLKIRHVSGWSDTCMIYYKLDKDNYYYPWHTLKSYNSKKEWEMNTTKYAKYNGGFKIITNDGIKPLSTLYDNPEYLGKVGVVYKKEYFKDFCLEKYYDKELYIPVGSCDILKDQYGENVFTTIISKSKKGKEETLDEYYKH